MTSVVAVMSRSGRDQMKLKGLLANLGRATMRGVRKCPRCGTLNGTRGNICKNKACGVRFRDPPCTVKSACRLDTGDPRQRLYSVRSRESGPEMRGFVQLASGSTVTGSEAADMSDILSVTQCFITPCQAALTAQDAVVSPMCRHITKVAVCDSHSTTLSVHCSVLSQLSRVSQTVRQQLLILSTETSGPLVQRVSPCYFVVKCRPCRSFPLGYLHTYFSPSSQTRVRRPQRFHCPCLPFKDSSTVADSRRCLHVYACLCAFLSCDRLRQEFSYFVDLELRCQQQLKSDVSALDVLSGLMEPDGGPSVSTCTLHVAGIGGGDALSTALHAVNDSMDDVKHDLHDTQLCEVSLHVLGDTNMLQEAVALNSMECSDVSVLDDVTAQLTDVTDDVTSAVVVTSQRRQDLHKSTVDGDTATPAHAHSGRLAARLQFNSAVQQEIALWVSFYDWLGSVTEMINMTMDYQRSGSPDPLVFLVPRSFFSAMKERISRGVKKRRLPNQVTTVSRTASPPYGDFMQYTWLISNILHVKSIFDGPSVVLNVARNFDYCSDSGTYRPASARSQLDDELQASTPGPRIVPQHYRTVLKVGCMSPQQSEPTPFVIEWIPNLLPESGMGELTLRFQFVHQHCGVLVSAPVSHAAARVTSHVTLTLPRAGHVNMPRTLAPRPSGSVV